MSKPFLTYNEQVQLLETRGACTDENTRLILMRENYYCVVNGYKDSFLLQGVSHEQFKPGTQFRDIYTLFLLDRELRFLFLKYILTVEASMKTTIAYRASEFFCGVPEFYRTKESFTDDPRLAKEVEKLVSKLESVRRSDAPSVAHYLERHGAVPFWILVNSVTFGTLSYFYKLIGSRSVQQHVVNDLCRLYRHDYTSDIRLTVKRLERDLRVLVDFRNACAHDERFYCRICKRVNISPDSPADAAYLYKILNLYLSKDSAKTLNKELLDLQDSFTKSNSLDPETARTVLSAIGINPPR
jgi:abortive infection bacteriophage resistance protein